MVLWVGAEKTDDNTDNEKKNNKEKKKRKQKLHVGRYKQKMFLRQQTTG